MVKIKTVGVAGAGLMGAGITYCSALAGFATVLFDISELALEKARKSIEKNFKKAEEKGKITQDQSANAQQLISYVSDIQQLKGDLIIEAIVEKLEVKRDFFKQLEQINAATTILASNTSSIPITQIAASLKRPENFVGIHFFNPAHLMKLVEIIKGARTSKEVVLAAESWANELGKTTIVAADSPGFIVNRVARHYYVEALKIAEENVAHFETIDRLCENFGFRMGPFKLMDLIGVDTNYSVTNSMFEQFNYDSKFRPNRIQKQKVDAGMHGVKTGQGFYSY